MSLRLPSFIEPLESRIAPAVIYVGALPADSKYTDVKYFHSVDPTNPTPGSYLASDPVGANYVGGVGTPDTYYLKLTTGDSIVYDSTGGAQNVLNLYSGNVVAFFVDKNHDKVVNLDEFTGMSLGNYVYMTLSDSVNGDVVTNFNDATGKIVPTGLVSNTQSIWALAMSGFNIKSSAAGHVGHLIAGGWVQNVQAGEIQEVLTGTAANGKAYNFNALDNGGTNHTLSVSLSPGQAGAGVIYTSLAATDLIQASDGGAQGAGGPLLGITVGADTDGLMMKAGNGGNGVSPYFSGGAGGYVSSILVKGAPTLDNSSINISAGNGGNGVAGTGYGGAGGVVLNTFVGYDALSSAVPSKAAPNADITISSGSGGSGIIGGAGGYGYNVQAISATLDTLHSHTVLISAGNGGASNKAGGYAGAGGALYYVGARNLGLDPSASAIVQAGNGGGVGAAGAAGGAGGSITTANLLGLTTKVIAGDGSGDIANAFYGGAGGSLTTITLEENEVGVRSHVAEINAGKGGDAFTYGGGYGGNIYGLKINNADFQGATGLQINQGTHGNGGSSAKYYGGAGGYVYSLQIVDVNVGGEGDMTLRAGNGGDGAYGGGAGGFVYSATISAEELNLDVASGSGGSATTQGYGGAGGYMYGLALATNGQVAFVDAIASVISGKGGSGMTYGAGGSGGDIYVINAIADGDVTVVAGDGGSGGASGYAGRGGNVYGASSEISNNQAVGVFAGDAGALGLYPGYGGSIITNSARAATDVTYWAGNGSNGGAGGSIQNIAYSNFSVPAGSVPAPQGSVSIRAGDGSGGTYYAGPGGALSYVTGYVGQSGQTEFAAGDGKATTNGKVSSYGGSVSNVNILGGGSSSVLFTIKAGDAGDAPLAYVGAAGGSVTNVNVAALASGTNFRSIAAGNGGQAATYGGTGGLIYNVHVNHDIGQINLRGSFTLSFAGDTTTALPYNATPTQVQDALNLLPGIIAAGGVAVSGDPTGLNDNKTGPFVSGGNGGPYDISFFGPQFLQITADTSKFTLSAPMDINLGPDATLDGSVQTIQVHLPPTSQIPVYGYDKMGGLFAGAGGAATVPGTAGSVSYVTADSIAAIVAGRGSTPKLASYVDQVYLNAIEKAQTGPTGAFTNMITANIVGSVVNPNIAGANVFKGTAAAPIDGLVATKVLTTNVNFKPQALTLDGVTIIQ